MNRSVRSVRAGESVAGSCCENIRHRLPVGRMVSIETPTNRYSSVHSYQIDLLDFYFKKCYNFFKKNTPFALGAWVFVSVSGGGDSDNGLLARRVRLADSSRRETEGKLLKRGQSSMGSRAVVCFR